MSDSEKGEDKSFRDGIEHVAIHYAYTLDTQKEVEKHKVPRAAARLMK